MNCTQIRTLLNSYIDGELDQKASRAVEAHTAMCNKCRTELASLSLLARAAASIPQVQPPADLARRILAATTQEQVRTTERFNWLARLVTPPKMRWAICTAAAGLVAVGLIVSIPNRPCQQLEQCSRSAVAPTVKPKAAITAVGPREITRERIVSPKPSIGRNMAATVVKQFHQTPKAHPVNVRIALGHASADNTPAVPEGISMPDTNTIESDSSPEAEVVVAAAEADPEKPEAKANQSNELEQDSLVKVAVLSPSVSRDNAEWIRQMKLQERLGRQALGTSQANTSDSRL